MRTYILPIVCFIILLHLNSCGPDPVSFVDPPYQLKSPAHMPVPDVPSTNPLTINKIKLGRLLFYDKLISQDQKIACVNCHKQGLAFGSDKPLDQKVHGASTTRNSSTLFNLVYTRNFFWDGRTKSLETTCLDAMKGEQNFSIDYVKTRLMTQQIYKDAFKKAYNSENPTEEMCVMALSSFIRTMISANSKVDKGIIEGNVNKYLSGIEIAGKDIFESEKGDCFHCHGDANRNPIMTDNDFHNNGMENFMSYGLFIDKGLGSFTGFQEDNGKFKTPPIRNISFSKPYMHDGRFTTIDAVLTHYDRGVQNSITKDVNMKKASQGGMKLAPNELSELKAYILSFDDPSFISDTSFSSPF